MILNIKTPKIYGIYSGTIKSSYDNFNIAKNVEITIKQSWNKIYIKLETEVSISYSQMCSISMQENEVPTIIYQYLNEPKGGSANSMSIHYGMCTLYFNDKEISGEFFTGRGRQTYGTINAIKQNSF